ncbi:cytochrome b [Rhizobium sp.]|uniref:cytochrome b n=1 Tax=Rhizobium sp. TaxID=391 RepID=UPI002F17596B
MSNFNRTAADERATRYDPFTIALHWLTALLVLTLFAMAQVWDFAGRGTPLRLGLISLHVSLGILLAVVLVLRIVWRLLTHRRMAPAVSGLQHVASSLVHLVLYALMISQVFYGFLMRWASASDPEFFGLFSIPPFVIVDPAMRRLFSELHSATAWAIIVIAGIHAVVALVHHYVLRDRVLARMMPTRG